jgi:hypothetical protein
MLTAEERKKRSPQGTSMQLSQAESLNPGPSIVWRYAIRNTSSRFFAFERNGERLLCLPSLAFQRLCVQERSPMHIPPMQIERRI